MSPGSSTVSYPAFARIGLRENPGKNLNQVTGPDRDSNPNHLASRPDALTVTPQACTSRRVNNVLLLLRHITKIVIVSLLHNGYFDVITISIAMIRYH
ncbi:hypothetical protein ANN_22022 [Periplaneta americana]|uniref:Uncharacterized protein n=1 Tax=Periplaneta americana TaxID=6978 RepID=A0ABQ8S7A4_PERAM|nr:hypothetical protein ANN_22022 [Periplaneta americana]